MADSPTPVPDVFSLTVEDLTDEAETRDGVLDREAVDVLYLRRGIEPEQAIAIERALKSAGIVIREDEPESPPPAPTNAPGPSATAIDYLLWCARDHRFLSHDEEAAYGEAVQRARLVEEKPDSERSDSDHRLVEAGARARSRLVLSNIRLVAKFAHDPGVRGRLEMDDLVQVGLLGLMRAASRYDPAFETRFSTYAVWWIRQSISRTIDDQGHTIRLPVHVQERVRKYRRARRSLGSDGASRPDLSRVADALGWTETDTARIASLAEMRVVSLDDGLDPRGETTYAERMEADTPSPESVCEIFERDERLRRLVEGLRNRRLQDIVVGRFGLDGDDALTLQELGERFGVTRERIRQLEAKALRNLRQRAYAGEFLPSEVPDR